jgi:hypothetical protein
MSFDFQFNNSLLKWRYFRYVSIIPVCSLFTSYIFSSAQGSCAKLTSGKRNITFSNL